MLHKERDPHRRKGPAERMWAPIKIKFTDNYKYVADQHNFGYVFLYYFSFIVGMPFVYLFAFIKWGFRVIDGKNVRLLNKKSAITVANHVHNIDSFMLTKAFYLNSPYVIALKHNFEAVVVGGLVRILRGIPLPTDIQNFRFFSASINDLLNKKNKRVHFYPEGEIKPFCTELRRFQSGAFHFAIKNNVPILPLVFVFPKEYKIRLIVGKPVYIEDIAEAKGLSEPKQVSLYAKHVKNIMQNMMDDFYSKNNKK